MLKTQKQKQNLSDYFYIFKYLNFLTLVIKFAELYEDYI